MLGLLLFALAADGGAAVPDGPPCPRLQFVPVPAANAPTLAGERTARSGIGLSAGAHGPSGTNEEEYAEKVGSTFVVLRGDRRLSGAALDLARPQQGWRTIPLLDLGEWTEDGGLADKLVPVGDSLIAAWFRGKRPIRIAVYRPGENKWLRPRASAPKNAWYAEETALRDYWIAWAFEGPGGFRFKVATLEWLPMRAPPDANVGPSWPNAAFGNKAFFLSPELEPNRPGGYSYDAAANAWTGLPARGAVAAAFAYVSPSGRAVALTQSGDGLGLTGSGAVLEPGASEWREIAGADELTDLQPIGVAGVGEYVVSFYNPGDPMYALDLAAARWRPIRDPPGAPARPSGIGILDAPGPDFPQNGGELARAAPQPLIFLASGQSLFLGNPDCIGGACDATGHVGAADTIEFYDAGADRWCTATMPAAERSAVDSDQGFAYEQLSSNRLLLWEATTSADFNPRGLAWTPENTRVARKPKGGVLRW